ncbi:unnamed protein product [Closterium sp. Naga37s-1]|nr:unnamed protein product [Closterium sp. Naga37s-1]
MPSIFSLSSLPSPTAVLFLIVGFQLGWISTSVIVPAWQQQHRQQGPCVSPDDPGCARGNTLPFLSFFSSSFENSFLSGARSGELGSVSEEPCNASLVLLKQQQDAILQSLQEQEVGIQRLQQLVAARNGSICNAPSTSFPLAPSILPFLSPHSRLTSSLSPPLSSSSPHPLLTFSPPFPVPSLTSPSPPSSPSPPRHSPRPCAESAAPLCLWRGCAALMNRTLVIPTQGIDYDYEAPLDLGAFDECMGPGRVITFSAYNASVRGRVRVGRYICHVHVYQTDQACDSLRLSYEARLHASFAKHEIARKRTPSPWFKYPTAEFLRKFHGDHHVIAFANMFGVGGRELRFHGRAPLVVRPECRGLLQPSRAIQEAAVGFINTFLGSRFIAIHLRRGDFFHHCIHGDGSRRAVPCFHPIHQLTLSFHQVLKPLLPYPSTSLLHTGSCLPTPTPPLSPPPRGDFFHHCIHGDGSRRAVPCFHPIHQLARCLHSRLQALPGSAMVFVASNAGQEEMRALSETLATLVSGEG